MPRIIGIEEALVDIKINQESGFLQKINEMGIFKEKTSTIEDYLKKIKLKKGDRTIITDEELKKIQPALQNCEMSAGGTVRNIIKNLSSFGEDTGFIGAVGKGNVGEKFKKELNGIKDFTVQYEGLTGRVLTYITEDKERSFQVNFGVSTYLSKKDLQTKIQEGLMRETRMIVLSGFLFENENKEIYGAAKEALTYANKEGIEIAMALGGMDFLKKKSKTIYELITENKITIISLNQEESKSLTGMQEYQKAAKELIKYCDILSITRGKKGVLLKTKDREAETESIPLEEIGFYSKNGAGDAVISAVIYDKVNNIFDVQKTGNMASLAASIVMRGKSASIDKSFNYKKLRGN
jgi:sugar/nucleoside kinase (ribokinase family)